MKRKIIAIIAVVALISILCTVLVACNSEKDYRKRLENAGYIIMNKEQIESFGGSLGDDIDWVVGGAKMNSLTMSNEEYNIVIVYKFKSEIDAKDEYKNLDEESESGWIVERKGKIVIFGTKQGVKDALGQ